MLRDHKHQRHQRSSTARFLLFLALLAAVPLSAQDLGKTSPAPNVPTTFGSGGAGAIGPGDLLEVSVFDTPELSGKARVSDTGEITLPLIGALRVSGLTTDQAQSLIAKKLVEGQLLKDPQVSVFVAEYATKGVSVLGEVKHPGIYPALGVHRLLDYISLAEGLTPLAGSTVSITPRGSASSRMVTLAAKSAPTADANPEIAPGSTIFVTRAPIVYVIGDVGKPGGFVMDQDQRLTVLQALALAQGVNSTAAKSRARLIRQTPQGRQELPLNLGRILSARADDLPLQDNDIVFVPSSASRSAIKSLPGIMTAVAAAAIYHF